MRGGNGGELRQFAPDDSQPHAHGRVETPLGAFDDGAGPEAARGAKVEWHPGELVPRVGLDPLRGSSVTNLSRPAERVVAFYNQRGKAEQYIKEGKNAIKWTRLSCRKFRDNEVRLQLHALAYNLANFMRTLALPKEVEHWSLTTRWEKLVKIGAKVVSHGRYVTFQLAEVAVPRELFREILRLIDDLRRRPVPASVEELHCEVETTGGVCLDDDKIGRMGFRTPPTHQDQAVGCQRRKNIPAVVQFGYGRSGFEGYLGNAG